MTREEHLLVILSEEFVECAHRASKAARFGLFETQAGYSADNRTRLIMELNDVIAVLTMLKIDGDALIGDNAMIAAKKAKVEEYIDYSSRLGKIDERSNQD